MKVYQTLPISPQLSIQHRELFLRRVFAHIIEDEIKGHTYNSQNTIEKSQVNFPHRASNVQDRESLHRVRILLIVMIGIEIISRVRLSSNVNPNEH